VSAAEAGTDTQATLDLWDDSLSCIWRIKDKAGGGDG